MNKLTLNLLILFSAGCVGGLANSIIVWLFGLMGITKLMGVSIAPALTPSWLYPRIVWGGIWGILFLLPFFSQQVVTKAFVYSLGPTFIQLFIVFPLKAKKGFMGMDLGTITPLFVILFNFVWGITTAVLIKIAKKD